MIILSHTSPFSYQPKTSHFLPHSDLSIPENYIIMENHSENLSLVITSIPVSIGNLFHLSHPDSSPVIWSPIVSFREARPCVYAVNHCLESTVSIGKIADPRMQINAMEFCILYCPVKHGSNRFSNTSKGLCQYLSS